MAEDKYIALSPRSHYLTVLMAIPALAVGGNLLTLVPLQFFKNTSSPLLRLQLEAFVLEFSGCQHHKLRLRPVSENDTMVLFSGSW